MFCPNCGTQMSDTAAFCKSCGTAVNKNNTDFKSTSAGLVGYSQKINDPAFTKYKKQSSAWSLIFSIIIALIAVIAFPIYGNVSGEIEFPTSLYYGLGIGGMFIVIALIQTASKNADKDWDGIVINKDARKVLDNRHEDSVHYRNVYVLKIRKDKGGEKTHKWYDSPGLYNYYQVGDRVRHHKGFNYYEKYDKSKDTQIMCAACMTMNDISSESCTRCKCPLLK